eukprot:1324214-Amorphochlora_amoeboformis.AAC.1
MAGQEESTSTRVKETGRGTRDSIATRGRKRGSEGIQALILTAQTYPNHSPGEYPGVTDLDYELGGG